MTHWVVWGLQNPDKNRLLLGAPSYTCTQKSKVSTPSFEKILETCHVLRVRQPAMAKMTRRAPDLFFEKRWNFKSKFFNFRKRILLDVKTPRCAFLYICCTISSMVLCLRDALAEARCNGKPSLVAFDTLRSLYCNGSSYEFF